jgi:DNA-binding transcriptional MerR regulator
MIHLEVYFKVKGFFYFFSGEHMTIGKLASTAGLNASAIRYYEKQGLLHAVRNESNYRVYTDQDLLRLQLIINSTKLGFTLNQIKQFLDTLFQEDTTLSDLDDIIKDKISEIDSRISLLEERKENLLNLIEKCPIHERLSGMID